MRFFLKKKKKEVKNIEQSFFVPTPVFEIMEFESAWVNLISICIL